jgi:hypothetical protein
MPLATQEGPISDRSALRPSFGMHGEDPNPKLLSNNDSKNRLFGESARQSSHATSVRRSSLRADASQDS